MDTNRAIEILKLLSDGIDPFTGEIFPENSPYQHPDTVRALFKAIDALRKIQSREVRQKNLPENTGKSWSEEEDNQLIDKFDSGKSCKEISEEHKRTEGAIKSRLIKLGKLVL
jgi:DNA-binding NarL/FixJ family response regulator